MSLPAMLYGSGIGKYNQTSYGGYNHNLSAMDGQIYDMTNMSSDYAPLLSPRAQRYITRTLAQPNGLYATTASIGWTGRPSTPTEYHAVR